MVYLFLKYQKLNNTSNKQVICDRVYHAHYTANLIEDEIRRIRTEDYPLRQKYAEMNGSS